MVFDTKISLKRLPFQYSQKLFSTKGTNKRLFCIDCNIGAVVCIIENAKNKKPESREHAILAKGSI